MKNARMTICLVVAVLFMATSQGFGIIEFKDGGTHNINYTIRENVWVDWQASGVQTTINLLNGGDLGGYFLNTYNNSLVTISGGSVYSLQSYNNCLVTVSGGQANSLYARDSSQVTMSGGKLTNHLMCNDSSQVTMLGGQVGYLMSYNSSQVTMSGGIVSYHLLASDSGRLTISGGSVSEYLLAYGNSQITMSGGTITQDLRVGQNATLVLDGTNFAINGTSISSGEIKSILGGNYYDDHYRILTGTLANGDIINNQFRIGDTAKIVLVPEPATLSLLAIGGLCLRKRR